MLGGLNSLKRTKLGGVGFGQSGSAAQKLALDSLQNIANIDIASTGTATPDIDAEVEAVGNVLRAAATPLSVAKVAEHLPSWETGRVAKVLARGGQSGMLKFFRDGETTMVDVARG